MHRHALATRDIADDLLSANGVATSGAVDQQIVMAFDLDSRAVAAEDAPSHAGEAAAIALLGPLRLMSGKRLRLFRRHQPRQDGTRRILAVADRRQQVVGLAEAMLVGD